MKRKESFFPKITRSNTVIILSGGFLVISLFLAFAIINLRTTTFKAESSDSTQTIQKIEEIGTNPVGTPEQITPSSSPSTIASSPVEETKNFTLPILMYHYVRNYNDPNDQIGTNLSVSPAKFEEQMALIKSRGYNTISLDQLSSKAIPEKSIIITFDDGYADAYSNAYPILQKYNLTAAFYIITSKVETPNYLTWAQIQEMNQNNMTIGSHTISHPSLEKASREKTIKELEQSKKTIEEKIGQNIKNFCYPSGKYNQETINILRETGYSTATTTQSGITNQDSSLFELPRIRVTNHTDLSKYLP